MNPADSDAVEIPVDGVLDLHTFHPRDAASVVEEYLWACMQKGIQDVRIIHGKGKGVLRRTVHSRLSKHPHVLRYHLDDGPSGWGSTLVWLKAPQPRKNS